MTVYLSSSVTSSITHPSLITKFMPVPFWGPEQYESMLSNNSIVGAILVNGANYLGPTLLRTLFCLLFLFFM